MRSFLASLLLLPGIVFAGNNSFLEQDFSKIKQKNQQVGQRMSQSSQQAAAKAKQVQQKTQNNNALRSILYSPKKVAKAPAVTQSSQVHKQVKPQQQPQAQQPQYTRPTQTKPAGTGTATGFSKPDDQSSQEGSSGWNYGY